MVVYCFNYWSPLSTLSIILTKLVLWSTQVGTPIEYPIWYPVFLIDPVLSPSFWYKLVGCYLWIPSLFFWKSFTKQKQVICIAIRKEVKLNLLEDLLTLYLCSKFFNTRDIVYWKISRLSKVEQIILPWRLLIVKVCNQLNNLRTKYQKATSLKATFLKNICVWLHLATSKHTGT